MDSTVRWQGQIEQYLATKRALGCKFASEDRMLRLLDRFLVEQRIGSMDDITGECLEQFLASRERVNPRSYNHLLGVVRRLFDWIVSQQAIPTSPLQLRPRRETARRLPFLFEPAVIKRLLAEAALLPDNPRSRMRGPTYETIFALLAGLGLRIGEVSRLQCGDVDLERDVLQIRDSKFGKSRLVPFGPRLAARVRAYLELRERMAGPAPTVRRCSPGTAGAQSAPTRSAIRSAMTCCHAWHSLCRPGPPVHACTGCGTPSPCARLLRWYREGVAPATKLNHLSTFLGHVNPASTAVYLTITSELLHEANRRFESFAPTLAEVQS